MSHFVHIAGEVLPSASGASRAADIVAALAPPKADATKALVSTSAPSTRAATSLAQTLPKAVMGVAPRLVGAAAGALLWKKHRVLGALAGNAVAATALPLIKGTGDERKEALLQLGVEAAGIGGALMWEKHPVLGWLSGIAAGIVVTAFVPGSPARAAYEKLKK